MRLKTGDAVTKISFLDLSYVLVGAGRIEVGGEGKLLCVVAVTIPLGFTIFIFEMVGNYFC